MEIGTLAGGAREELLSLVRPWLLDRPPAARVATAHADANGWVAAVRDTGGSIRVVGSSADGDDAVVEDDASLLSMLRHVTGAAATDSARVRAARRAARRWLEADASARLATAGAGEAGARTAIARRLDVAVRGAPLHQRAALQARVTAVRTLVANLRGAGAERALAAAAQLSDLDALLEALEQLSAVGNSALGRTEPARLLALLLLTRGE
jgi:hypothetical protein